MSEAKNNIKKNPKGFTVRIRQILLEMLNNTDNQVKRELIMTKLFALESSNTSH